MCHQNPLYELDFNGRYFTEDVPALVVLYDLARLMGVELPTVKRIIEWAQTKMPDGYQYILKVGSDA
jgi:hypothetical protein